eukprot:m.190683 g.190683  ORF g.190683 m.190683 type:complete len:917 (+) comp10045_c0_seq6:513-3263(+)
MPSSAQVDAKTDRVGNSSRPTVNPPAPDEQEVYDEVEEASPATNKGISTSGSLGARLGVGEAYGSEPGPGPDAIYINAEPPAVQPKGPGLLFGSGYTSQPEAPARNPPSHPAPTEARQGKETYAEPVEELYTQPEDELYEMLETAVPLRGHSLPATTDLPPAPPPTNSRRGSQVLSEALPGTVTSPADEAPALPRARTWNLERGASDPAPALPPARASVVSDQPTDTTGESYEIPVASAANLVLALDKGDSETDVAEAGSPPHTTSEADASNIIDRDNGSMSPFRSRSGTYISLSRSMTVPVADPSANAAYTQMGLSGQLWASRPTSSSALTKDTGDNDDSSTDDRSADQSLQEALRQLRLLRTIGIAAIVIALLAIAIAIIAILFRGSSSSTELSQTSALSSSSCSVWGSTATAPVCPPGFYMKSSAQPTCGGNATYDGSRTCIAPPCPANSSGIDVPSGCACLPGFTGSVNATSSPPYYTGSCAPASCPENSTRALGNSTRECTCAAGFTGSVAPIVGGFNSTCMPAPCPDNTTGTAIVSGCTCPAGFAGPLVPAVGAPFYSGRCAAVPCPSLSNGTDAVVGCTCNPGCSGNVTATTTAPYYVSSCVCLPGTRSAPAVDCSDIYRQLNASMTDGVYYITAGQGTANAFMVFCKVLAGTAFTMVMNLNTRDGNVFWWGNSLWQSTATYGTLTSSYAFATDIKSPAWNYLTGQTRIMLIVHQQGTVVGWKSWRRSAGTALGTMASYFTLGNCASNGNAPCNQVLADTVDQFNTSSISPAEALVRLTAGGLYANYGLLLDTFPDLQRFGSPEACPQGNVGGGIGTWHDAGLCYSLPSGSNGFGFSCSGDSSYRTCSEAQGGWCSSYTKAPGGADSGTFGTDSCVPMTCSMVNSGNTANWAAASGINYDYMVLLGRYA